MVHISPTTTTDASSGNPSDDDVDEKVDTTTTSVVAHHSSSVRFATTTTMPATSMTTTTAMSTPRRYVSEGQATVTVKTTDPLNTNGDHNKNYDNYFEVPKGHGVLIRLHSEDGSVSITTCPDRNFPEIHPHCYAPASMRDMKLLHGGGSGTAVFGGSHPDLHEIVMKHANSRDTKEVFSLATIASELRRRQRINGNQEAAYDMKKRIPEFVGVYISPFHLRDRGKELWASLRTITYTPSGRRLSTVSPEHGGSIRMSTRLTKDELQKLQKLSKFQPHRKSDGLLDDSLPHRTIRIHTGSHRLVEEWCVSFHVVDMYVPSLDANHRILCDDTTTTNESDLAGDPQPEDRSTQFLQELALELIKQEDTHNWKVTLAQKKIGGDDAMNGADVLTSGKLYGPLLETLIREFSQVMDNLHRLTLPEERCGRLDRVRQELQTLREQKDVRCVSKIADAYCGKAILKNFHPDNGRFRNLRLLGEDFRDGDFFLTDAERIPARFLGIVLQRGVNLEVVFEEPPATYSALDHMETRGWLDILEHATEFDTPGPTDCIWTCGLTDAGLHNTFLSEQRGLELFDLGEPVLMPRPAFLTKFLMSFFHTSGMESDERGYSWKARFYTSAFRKLLQGGNERLLLTDETKQKIPYLHQVFRQTVDNFIEKIFDGDERVRKLLIKYVILQLLSDAAFCLRRWEGKGGGTQRYGEKLEEPLEKWLWRALWYIYIASNVHDKLLHEGDKRVKSCIF